MGCEAGVYTKGNTWMSRAKLRDAARATMRRMLRTGKSVSETSSASSSEGAKIYPFPAIIPQQDGHYPRTPVEVAVRMAALEAEIKGLKDLLAEVRQSRDAWREQVVRVTAALPPPRQACWWKRSTG